jgi:hypothetical protein
MAGVASSTDLVVEPAKAIEGTLRLLRDVAGLMYPCIRFGPRVLSHLTNSA